MKRDKLDAVFSIYIRTRDNWTCQKCHKVYPEKSKGLHCSHHYSRRYKSIRWEPLNACALCFSCHNWFSSEPIESSEWLLEYLGETKFIQLRAMRNKITKWTKTDKELLYREFKEKLKVMS
jgi:hypothetical protein